MIHFSISFMYKTADIWNPFGLWDYSVVKYTKFNSFNMYCSRDDKNLWQSSAIQIDPSLRLRNLNWNYCGLLYMGLCPPNKAGNSHCHSGLLIELSYLAVTKKKKKKKELNYLKKIMLTILFPAGSVCPKSIKRSRAKDGT